MATEKLDEECTGKNFNDIKFSREVSKKISSVAHCQIISDEKFRYFTVMMSYLMYELYIN